MKDFRHWLSQKSDTFSALMEEDVTIREVLLVHGIVLCGCGAAVVAATSLSATVAFLGVGVWLAWKLNKYIDDDDLNTLTREYMGWDEDGDRYREDDDED